MKKKRGLRFLSLLVFCFCLGGTFYFAVKNKHLTFKNPRQETAQENPQENISVQNTTEMPASDTSSAHIPTKEEQTETPSKVSEPLKKTEILSEQKESSLAVETLSFQNIQNMEAGTVFEEAQFPLSLVEECFFATDISPQVQKRIWNISYQENPHISLSQLRYLRLLHWGFDEKIHIGELIVNHEIAQDILEIMQELFENHYPIEKMILIDAYGGEDEASMADNNTSAFNYRMMTGSNKLSKHGMGLAIDINPRYNPYVKQKQSGEWVVSPENAWDYVDRTLDFDHKLTEKDLCVQLFLEHGFTWGGQWNSLKDYQHFEK